MKSLWLLAGALIAAAGAEIVFPGRDLYHAGWYNVGIAALTIVLIVTARKRRARAHAGWAALTMVVAGGAIAGLATVANGLFAPDDRTVVGAPGQRVRVDDLGGFLEFPLVAGDRSSGVPRVRFEGGILQSYVLRPIERQAVAVEARDPHGAHLTITQPAGVAFLSPVLLMQQRQTIAGMNLPFDSFAVPAARRVVKAVLFTPQQAAMLRGMEGLEVPAVLFAVDDESDKPLPNAIALGVDGQSVVVGGLLLRANVLDYPAVEIVAVPPIAAVALGALLVVGGMAWEIQSRRAAIRRATT